MYNYPERKWTTALLKISACSSALALFSSSAEDYIISENLNYREARSAFFEAKYDPSVTADTLARLENDLMEEYLSIDVSLLTEITNISFASIVLSALLAIYIEVSAERKRNQRVTKE